MFVCVASFWSLFSFFNLLIFCLKCQIQHREHMNKSKGILRYLKLSHIWYAGINISLSQLNFTQASAAARLLTNAFLRQIVL